MFISQELTVCVKGVYQSEFLLGITAQERARDKMGVQQGPGMTSCLWGAEGNRYPGPWYLPREGNDEGTAAGCAGQVARPGNLITKGTKHSCGRDRSSQV